jgi:cation diffusion facilitator CzcD-associated flavoprotein CzcO
MNSEVDRVGNVEGDGTHDSDLDLLIVGAGFGGLYALHRARQHGLSARVIEAGDDVGGTWYWNRYPGARCDVESVEYSYGFSEELQQEWVWSERYASQPEILRYAQHVADRFDLRRDITFDTRVVSAAFDESADRWEVHLEGGHTVSARFFVLATGCLSAANVPDIPGLDTFAGPVLHTGRWPRHKVDLTGTRVGIIGTGSSGIQAIPVIAQAAAELTVFQRTASYTIPAQNRPLTTEELAQIKADYAGFRARNRAMAGGFGSHLDWNTSSALADTPAQRQAQYEARWQRGGFCFVGSYGDTSMNMESNTLAAEFVREKIRSIVTDPEVAEALCPAQPISCKRIALDSGYYETFNRPNVRLVDLARQPIEAVDAGGITVGGEHIELDVLVLATGYDAMTGSYTGIDITGRGGRTLKEAWAAGPLTYLGLGVPDFPNLFIVAGPGSPSVLTNMVLACEQHVEWIIDCVSHLRAHDLHTIEATDAAAHHWVAHVNEMASHTLYPTCNSWYLGANIPGKPRVFMPLLGFPAYEARCNEVAATGYDGFEVR